MEGLALLCRTDGTIYGVVQNTLEGATVDESLSTSAEWQTFIRTVVRARFARSMPLRIGSRDAQCFGACVHDDVRVVGVIDPATAAPFAEQVGFTQLAEEIRRTHSTYELYEELARLNNELVTAQRELARTVAELQRLNAYKDELLGMAAHDLRNPLNANAAYITFLLGDTDGMTDDQLVLLDRLRVNSNYMLRLVENVLDFSAIQAGHVRLQCEETSLAAIAMQVVETMRIIAEPKNVEIAYTVEEMPDVSVDRVKIMEALQNLVSNAVQYSPPESRIEVRVRARGAFAELEVEDHGPGIAAEDVPQLFKPFTRLATSPHARQRSVGLGLAITKRLIEAHGGMIAVKTEVGQGSTFTLRVPLRPPTPSPR